MHSKILGPVGSKMIDSFSQKVLQVTLCNGKKIKDEFYLKRACYTNVVDFSDTSEEAEFFDYIFLLPKMVVTKGKANPSEGICIEYNRDRKQQQERLILGIRKEYPRKRTTNTALIKAFKALYPNCHSKENQNTNYEQQMWEQHWIAWIFLNISDINNEQTKCKNAINNIFCTYLQEIKTK